MSAWGRAVFSDIFHSFPQTQQADPQTVLQIMPSQLSASPVDTNHHAIQCCLV